MSPVQRPSRDEVTVFPTAAHFRAWLEANHDRVDALFIGFYRKGVGARAMTYPEAVDEALCFGWIDGITYGVDDELRAVRFTPRRRTSSWSAVNLAKVQALSAAGRMHPAGIRAHEERDRRKDQIYSYEQPPRELPPDMLARLRADGAAWTHWQAETPSYRRTATYWVTDAKRPETRERRFVMLLEESRSGGRPRPFRVASQERTSQRASRA
ncbi:MAG TPA: YdeI/OmpD-associated family protein [Candidatus Angelobacter sp.]|nr:YdeI/OmpD-associated family protein [Candidatus Angelobacter sp.]